MIKKTVRKDYLQRRMDIPEEDLQQQTALMAFNFKKLTFPPVKYLMSYSPLLARREFDVSVCEDMLKQQNPSLQTAWPRIEEHSSEMEATLVQRGGLFTKNRYNVLEPISGDTIAPELLDVIFVPLVAFDEKGYRVGYGKGYYDRYMARCRHDIIRVGFSFFEAIRGIEDINQYDVPLNFCITPYRIYEF
jgi:5-formyltetrahydrofolate cyclo-ligase